VNAIQIAVTMGLTPGKETMSAKQYPFRSGILLQCFLDPQGKFKTGPLPRQPENLAIKFAIEFLQFALAVRARGKGNRPIRMQMIHVDERKKRVQWSINGRRDSIVAKGGKRAVGHHFVLVLLAAVKLLELLQFVQIEQCETRFFD